MISWLLPESLDIADDANAKSPPLSFATGAGNLIIAHQARMAPCYFKFEFYPCLAYIFTK